MNNPAKSREIEWPTLGLILVCMITVPFFTAYSSVLSLWVALPVVTITLALHSSIQHEVLHGHPFNDEKLNEAMVFLSAGLFVPYRRFRDLHILHHFDPRLTDPYDDPETNFLDPEVWDNYGIAMRFILTLNNSLAGRMVLGPVIGLYSLYRSDLKLALAGDRAVITAYLMHFAGLLPVVFWLIAVSSMPIWAYLTAAYGAMSLLKIRTYLEHRAHENPTARTVIIEDRGFFALLFLNNNFHAVHHAFPKLQWYKLPQVFAEHRMEYLKNNGEYCYPNYRSVFRQYLFRNKDQIPHPLWSQNKR